MFKLLRKLKRNRRLHEYKKRDIYLSEVCDIDSSVVFEGHNYIGYNTHFRGTIGFGSYIGSNSKIRASIGRYCSISDDVVVINGFHPTDTFLSTHPAFYSTFNSVCLSYCDGHYFDEFRYADAENKLDITIGNDVWIGKRVSILAGVKISDGAVIAAGSVVTRDVAPYAIVAGVPARIIRYRFDDEQRQKLMELAWWNKSQEWLAENAEVMRDISKIDELFKRLNDTDGLLGGSL